MSSQQLNTDFNIFLGMQCNFSLSACRDIFGVDYLHYWEKWESSQDNILKFITRLDRSNRSLLFTWGTSLYA